MNFTSNSTTNGTSGSLIEVSPSCYVDDPSSVKSVRVISYSTLISLSLAGNIFVIAAIYKYGRARKTINYAIVNVAVADLFITAVYMPRLIAMYLWGSTWFIAGDLGYALCKIVPFVHGVAIIASVLTLFTTSLDTFCAVVFPLKKLFTIKAAKLAVLLTWALSVVVRLPYFLALQTKLSKGRLVCSANLAQAFDNKDARDIYYVFLFVTLYALPWLAILIFYSVIVIRLKQATIPKQEPMTAFRLKRARARATRNVVKMMIIITVVFVACWIMYFLAQIAFRSVPCNFRFWRLFLAHCNCATNPILFALFNGTVQRAIKDVYKTIRPTPRNLYVCNALAGKIVGRKIIRKRKLHIHPMDRRHGAPAFSTISGLATVHLQSVIDRTRVGT